MNDSNKIQDFKSSVKEFQEAGGIELISSIISYIIPGVNLVYDSHEVFKKYQTKRYKRFFDNIERIYRKFLEDFKQKLDRDQELKETFCENLLLHLDRLDDIKKYEILGKIYKSYIEKQIGYNKLRELFKAINDSFIGDLIELTCVQNNKYSNLLLQKLIGSGLSELNNKAEIYDPLIKGASINQPVPVYRVVKRNSLNNEPLKKKEIATLKYQLSDLGKLYIEIIRDEKF